MDVTVLTAQWEEHWPVELTVRDTRVLRFPIQNWSLLPRRTLGTRISEWMRKNAANWDRIVVVGNLEGGNEIFQTARRMERPCGIHILEAGPASVWEDSEFRQRHQKQMAHWFSQSQWLVPAGHLSDVIRSENPAAVVEFWNPGIPAPVQFPARQEVRFSLASSHPVLRGSKFLPVVVFDGNFDNDSGQSLWMWRMVQHASQQRMDFRIWLCGDGPGLAKIYHSVVADSLDDQVLFPGYFSDQRDLYRSANLVLLPDLGRFNSLDFITSILVGTPVLLGPDTATELLAAIGHTEAQRRIQSMVVSGDHERWGTAIQEYLADPEPLQREVTQLRSELREVIPEEKLLQDYYEWLSNLGENQA